MPCTGRGAFRPKAPSRCLELCLYGIRELASATADLGSLYCTVCVQEFSKESRLDNFNLATKWEKQTLTWRVTKFPSNDLSDDLVISTMERAFSVWAKYADLTFIEVGSGQWAV